LRLTLNLDVLTCDAAVDDVDAFRGTPTSSPGG
jgi:hypothetical protein